MTRFYSRFRLIRNVRERQNFPFIKLIKTVILWIHLTIPFDFIIFGSILASNIDFYVTF